MCLMLNNKHHHHLRHRHLLGQRLRLSFLFVRYHRYSLLKEQKRLLNW